MRDNDWKLVYFTLILVHGSPKTLNHSVILLYTTYNLSDCYYYLPTWPIAATLLLTYDYYMRHSFAFY